MTIPVVAPGALIRPIATAHVLNGPEDSLSAAFVAAGHPCNLLEPVALFPVSF